MWKVAARYFWPNMTADVTNYVRRCEVCQTLSTKGRPSRVGAPIKPLDSAGDFLGRVHIDFAGPLPVTKRGSKYILVIIDSFTRMVAAVPTPDQTAATVARALLLHVVGSWGIPRTLASDNGTGFINSVITSMLDSMGIKKFNSIAYHPQGNAAAERSVKTVKERLTAVLAAAAGSDWDDLAPLVSFAINSTKCASTGFSPYELVFGRQARLPLDFAADPAPEAQDPSEFVANLRLVLSRLRTEAAEAEQRQKAKAVRSRRNLDTLPDFQPGDIVWLLSAHALNPRHPKPLVPIYGRKVAVERKLSEVSYLVRRLGSKKLFKVHVERLKSFLSADGGGAPEAPLAPDEEDEAQAPDAAAAAAAAGPPQGVPAAPRASRTPRLPAVGDVIVGHQKGSLDKYLIRVEGVGDGKIHLHYLPRSAKFVGRTDCFEAALFLDAWTYWYPSDDTHADLEQADVGSIIGHRRRQRERQFLVRWRGEATEDEWKDEAELEDTCADLLRAYRLGLEVAAAEGAAH